MDGTIGSLFNLLSMLEFNSFFSLKFHVIACHMFPMLLLKSTWGGAQEVVMGHTELIPFLSTYLFPLVTGVETSTPVLMIIREVWFAPTFYLVVIAMTSSIVGNLSTFGALTNPVLMVNTG